MRQTDKKQTQRNQTDLEAETDREARRKASRQTDKRDEKLIIHFNLQVLKVYKNISIFFLSS